MNNLIECMECGLPSEPGIVLIIEDSVVRMFRCIEGHMFYESIEDVDELEPYRNEHDHIDTAGSEHE